MILYFVNPFEIYTTLKNYVTEKCMENVRYKGFTNCYETRPLSKLACILLPLPPTLTLFIILCILCRTYSYS